jgi:hypothetical protein
MIFCWAYPNPVFQKSMRIILSITNAFPALVTTTFAHNFITGQIIRLIIPTLCGMQQANQLLATIVVTGTTTFLTDIDSTYFDPFVVPSSVPPGTTGFTCPQVVPVGEVSALLTAATQNVLPYSAT